MKSSRKKSGGFTTWMTALPPYDFRSDHPESENYKYGACGMRLFFYLRGKKGVIEWELNSSLTADAISDRAWPANKTNPIARTGKPGYDFTSYGVVRPTPGPITVHSPVQLHKWEMHKTDTCTLFEDGKCYSDFGYLAGDHAMKGLLSNGSDGVYEVLHKFYRSWILGEKGALDG